MNTKVRFLFLEISKSYEYVGPESVGIATVYGLDDPGIKSR